MQVGYSGCAHTAPLRGRLATESRVDAPLIVVGSKAAQLAPQVNTAPESHRVTFSIAPLWAVAGSASLHARRHPNGRRMSAPSPERRRT